MQREGGKKGVLKQAQELVNRGVGNGLKGERERIWERRRKNDLLLFANIYWPNRTNVKGCKL